MARFCASCGTEVDDTAVFCPTCGQPIEDETGAEMPAAPSWPDPAAAERPMATSGARAEREDDDVSPAPDLDGPRAHDVADDPTRVEQRPPPGRGEERPAPQPRPQRQPLTMPRVNLPITPPVTLSGWLIGGGAVAAAIGILVVMVVGLLTVIDMLLLLALLVVAATIFFSAHVPAMRHLRLATLVVVLIGFGVALDRVGFRGGGVGELLFFLGTGAAAIGAVLLEAGYDQPLGRPS